MLSKVHVWNAHFDPSNASADRQTQLLFQDERDRADRFHFARDRAHFIHSRAVVRALLGHYLDIPPEEVTFRYGRAGKPELLPCFMIRTCNSMCPIRAVTCLWLSRETVRCGIEIEMIRPEMNIEAIAERFFSSEETQQLRALTGLEKRQGFFSCWTRKEAYLSQGRGASVKFDQRDPDAVARSIRELSAESGFSAALAVEAADFELKKLQWNAF